MNILRVLCIGDVVGNIGCNFLRNKLPQLKKQKNINLVVANGENSSDGNGVTPASARFLFDSGVDVITSGNHAFRRKESYEYYDNEPFIIRPANFPSGTTPGKGSCIVDMVKYQVCVINLMGTMFMDTLDSPFRIVDDLLNKYKDCKIKIIDFHAETTSEKQALAYYLDGKVSAVFGTHTHTQTADECILNKGTGFITDVGMTGTIHSILGVKPELVIKKFVERMPVRFDLADGECRMDCIIFDIDEKSGKTISVERLRIL